MSEQRAVLLLTLCLGTSAAHTRLEVVPGGGQASRCIFWNKQYLVPLLLSEIFICCRYCAMKLLWLEKLLVKSCSCTQDLWELTSPLSYSVMLVLWRYEPVLFVFFQQRRNKPSLYKHMMIYNLLGTTADTELPSAPRAARPAGQTSQFWRTVGRPTSQQLMSTRRGEVGWGTRHFRGIPLQHRKSFIVVSEHQTHVLGKAHFSYYLQKSCLF